MKKLTCKICSYVWWSAKVGGPVRCPNPKCQSPNWKHGQKARRISAVATLLMASFLGGLTAQAYFSSPVQAGISDLFRQLDESRVPHVGQRVFYQMPVFVDEGSTVVPNVQRKAAAIITKVYDNETVDLFVMEPGRALSRTHIRLDPMRSPKTWAPIESGDLVDGAFPE